MRELDALLVRLEAAGINLGLEHVRRLAAQLGDPQLRVPAVLVAGTNGKGSTAAHLAAILSSTGLTTGLYTSPHLETVEERIRIDGRSIDGDRLTSLLARVVETAAARGLTSPTYFEALTLAAFQHFADHEVEIAIYEVGLGGRLDATNIVEPVLSVITDISLDHQDQLGDSLAAIAGEKAGILRPGVPCCHAVYDASARRAIEALAEELGAPVVDARLPVGPSAATLDDRVPIVIRGRALQARVPPRQGGLARRRNLTLAVFAAETLARSWPPGAALDLDAGTVEHALASCHWPGRWERVRRPDGGWLLLDGAHNPHAAVALAESLAGCRYGLLFGALADKAIDAMLPPLEHHASWLVLTRPASARAADPATLAATLAPAAEVLPDPATALNRALALAAPDQKLVVCGSLYLVGGVRRLLRERWGRPEGTERIYRDRVRASG